MAEYRAQKGWPYAISCGGVVYKIEQGKRLYALLYRSQWFGNSGDSWHLPKGHLDSEETLERAALREILEESGCRVVIEAYLGARQAEFFIEQEALHIHKTVHYFLTRFEKEEQGMDQEHERIDWLPFQEAVQKLGQSPKQEEEILQRAEQYLSKKK